jgi:uncharacterized protein
MYSTGRGVTRDEKEAVRWRRKAAGNGYALAEWQLGSMLYYGQGVHQDHEKAVRWFQKAAKQGNAKGQFGLGLLYKMGHGVLRTTNKQFIGFGRRLNRDIVMPNRTSPPCI